MIEFIEEPHIYLCDGVIIPSVSEILHFIFPNKYLDVPEWILERKAEYGSKVHASIEHYEQVLLRTDRDEAFISTKGILDLDENQEFSLKQYIRLKDKYNIKVVTQEQMINYTDDYAGRFDMIANIDKDLCLCDIKTTAQLDKEYLSWQLSLYEFAYRSMYHTKEFDKLYAIWLPKRGYGELIEIERKNSGDILKMLKKFKESEKVE